MLNPRSCPVGRPHSRPRENVPGEYFIMIRKASADLVEFLARVDADGRSSSILGDIGGIEMFDEFGKYCTMNPRLVMIAYTDLRDTFRGLGYSTDDLTGPEGLGMIIVMFKLFSMGGVDIDRLSDPGYAAEMAEITSDCIRNVGGSLNIKGEEVPLLLHFVFSQSPGVFDWAAEYATLVYRWASVMVKADGTVTSSVE